VAIRSNLEGDRGNVKLRRASVRRGRRYASGAVWWPALVIRTG